MVNLRNCSAVIQADGMGNDRDTIVTSGRILMAESAKRRLNSTMSNKAQRFDLGLDDMKYAQLSNTHISALGKFASKLTNAAYGRGAAENGEISADMAYNETFLKICQDVMSDIITPMLPIVTNDMLGMFAETHSVPTGKTKEITIKSNAIFNYEETAEGVTSAANQFLYRDTVVLDPKPIIARAKIPWYEYFANNGDIGDLYNALALGWYAYVTGRFANTFNKALTNTDFTPSALNAASYSTKNFTAISSNLRRVNGGGKIVAFGDMAALSAVGPEQATEDSYRNMLGQEWAHVGYIKSYKGVDLYAVDNVIIPSTLNSTMTPIFDPNTIWLASINGAKPVHIGIGSERVSLQLQPTQTADNSIVVSNKINADLCIAMGSRIGSIKNVGV